MRSRTSRLSLRPILAGAAHARVPRRQSAAGAVTSSRTTYTSRMSSFALTLIFVAALLASSLVKFWLASRQMRHVAAHRDAVPGAFAQTISLAAHQKAA